MYNREMDAALAGLIEVGKKQLPMTVAINMAKCRRILEDRMRDVEGVRVDAVSRLQEYVKDGIIKKEDVTLAHPNFLELRKEINELMNIEFEPPMTFELYVRSNDAGQEEFCWTKGFKTAKFVQFDGQIVYGLMPLLNINHEGEDKEDV